MMENHRKTKAKESHANNRACHIEESWGGGVKYIDVGKKESMHFAWPSRREILEAIIEKFLSKIDPSLDSCHWLN